MKTKALPKKNNENTELNVFSFINDISYNKEYIFNEAVESEYVPWIVNRAFAMHYDSLYHASLMNQYHFIDKKMQHDYYHAVLPKKKRIKKWFKDSKEEKELHTKIEAVAKVLNYSIEKTYQSWNILNEEQRQYLLSKAFPNDKNEKK
jgi:hypothetical protein